MEENRVHKASRSVSMIHIHKRSIAAAFACLAAAALPAAAHACTLSTFPIFGGSSTLIATATADTLFAGPGGVRYEADASRAGGAAPRFHGQVVRVERLGSTAAAALPAGTERVVLVPWDLTPDCKTIPWTASAGWMEPGKRGLFHGALRDPADWVDGVPTLDVTQPWAQPYPDDVILQHQDGPLLTADEALELVETLPTYEEYRAGGERAWARLRDWVRDHPALACRYPATEVLLVGEDIGGAPRVPCASGEGGSQGGGAASADGSEVQPLPGFFGGGREESSGWGRTPAAPSTRREST
jgi:hypothetical protein